MRTDIIRSCDSRVSCLSAQERQGPVVDGQRDVMSGSVSQARHLECISQAFRYLKHSAVSGRDRVHGARVRKLLLH